MKTKYFLLFLISITFINCKLDKNEGTNSTETTNGAGNTSSTGQGLKITFNAKVDKDDSFFIFYNEDGSEKFSGDQMVEAKIVGSNDFQNIQFVLPDDAFPLNLRFDIGSNKDLKEVSLNDFKMEYKEKTFASKKGEFFKYFYPNAQVKLDTINSKAIIDCKEGDPFDPIIGGTLYLQNELKKLYEK